MQNYETVFITRPELTTNQVDKMTAELEGIIKSGGGKISRKENWGLRNLAFKVRKNKKGHYMMLNYQAKSETIFEIERKIKLNEDFIRFQTFKTKDLPTKPSFIAIKTAEHAQRRAESSAVVPINYNKPKKNDATTTDIEAKSGADTTKANKKDKDAETASVETKSPSPNLDSPNLDSPNLDSSNSAKEDKVDKSFDKDSKSKTVS